MVLFAASASAVSAVATSTLRTSRDDRAAGMSTSASSTFFGSSSAERC